MRANTITTTLKLCALVALTLAAMAWPAPDPAQAAFGLPNSSVDVNIAGTPDDSLILDAEQYPGQESPTSPECDATTTGQYAARLVDGSTFAICMFNGSELADVTGFRVHAVWDPDILEFDDGKWSAAEMDFLHDVCDPEPDPNPEQVADFSNLSGWVTLGVGVGAGVRRGGPTTCAAGVQLVRMAFSCQAPGSTTLKLAAPGTSTYFTDASGSPITPAVNTLEIRCYDPDVDSELDGCTNEQELGADEAAGGRRDPANFWDFLDVWTGSPPQRDGAVGVGDILAVVERFGASVAPPPSEQDALAEALTSPPPAPAYHASFDRGPGSSGTTVTPPDGVISISDITAVVSQFGHNCV